MSWELPFTIQTLVGVRYFLWRVQYLEATARGHVVQDISQHADVLLTFRVNFNLVSASIYNADNVSFASIELNYICVDTIIVLKQTSAEKKHWYLSETTRKSYIYKIGKAVSDGL